MSKDKYDSITIFTKSLKSRVTPTLYNSNSNTNLCDVLYTISLNTESLSYRLYNNRSASIKIITPLFFVQ